MAREQIAQLAARVVEEHDCVAVACVHGVGIVPLGGPSVVVGGAAGHRAEAVAAARAWVSAFRARALIWKKDHSEDARPAWAGGTRPQLEPRAGQCRRRLAC